MSTQAQTETYGARADAPAMSADDQTTKLHQMRDRLASLSDEARSIRSQMPHEFEPDVEHIQQQMQRLGERLADLSRGALVHYPPAGILSDNRAERPRSMSEEEAKVARAAPDEVIMLGGPVDMRMQEPLEPWDEASANALVQLYESGEAFSTSRQPAYGATSVQANRRAAVRATTVESDERSCACTPSSSMRGHGQESASGCAVDPSWLDRRFAEIAQRIEQSLAEIRPESSLLSLGKRFDELEAQMNSAFNQVATRADVDELRIAEAQIEDIGTQLNQLRRQLVRLDTIDGHLGTLTAQLSDDRLTRLFREGAPIGADAGRLDAIDSQLRMIALQLSDERLSGLVSRNATPDVNYEGLATAAAQKIAASFVDHKFSEAQTRDLGEMRGMLESLIHERRHSDENNASMLETMQQAIIRVLDRIDALEIAQQNAVASRDMPAATTPMMHAAHEMEADQADFLPMQGDDIAGAPYIHPFAQEGDTAPYAAPAAAPIAAAHMAHTPRAAAPQEAPPPAFSAAPFDLDAAFSRSRDAEAFGEIPLAPRSMDVLRHDFIADAHRAKIKAASRPERSADQADMRAGELSVKGVPAAPEKRGRRSIFSFRSQRVAMVVLVLLAAIPAALFFMPRNSSEVSVVPAAERVLPMSDETRSAPTPAIEGAAPAAPATDGDKAPIDNPSSKQSQQIRPQAPQGAGEFDDAAQPVKDISYAPVDTASLPDGIAVQSNDATTAQIVQHQQQARMAYLSGQLGVAAAKATPASLMEEQVLRMNGAPARTDDLAAGANSSRLPPPTVGPFSLRMAAAQGDASAQFEVASRLAEGKGLDQDLKEAAQWYQRSASNGFAMAQFRLGTLYERGLGVPTDQARAQVWYQRAAEQGNVKAMHNLAVLAAGRTTPPPDYKEAARWFAAAAELGLADSQYNLAVLYENGMGVPKDLKQAYKWLLLAANAGDSDAKGRRDALKAKLNVAELADAEVQAGTWRVKAMNPVANDAHVAGQAWKEPRRG